MAMTARDSSLFLSEDVVIRDTFDPPFTRDSYIQRDVVIDRAAEVDASDDRDDEGTASVELAAIMTATSTPVTPGPSSPPLEPPKSADFIPPTRPSSTPFPNAQQGPSEIRCLTCQPACFDPDVRQLQDPIAATTIDEPPVLSLTQLPAEIHECILDHIFGYRVSTSSPSSLSIPSVNARSWSTALRHSRRKELSNLALVSRLWRDLIQERLYRHIKLKATVAAAHDVMTFFVQHTHLSSYVKHVEIWFPVFQPKFHHPIPGEGSLALPTVSPEGIASATYGLPTDNATMEEVFSLVRLTFPEARVMTLEGGERKKAPRVRYSAPGPCSAAGDGELPQIPSIRTLIVKGQWNIIRQPRDWENISKALPSLEEWHGTYAKPKSKSYLSMAHTLDILDHKITKLNLCLECDYRREITCPPYYLKVCEQVHWCEKLARAASHIEHLSYTGRICHGFFDLLARYTNPRLTRLKTIDITVKNCCRQNAQWNESGSGITDMHFIGAFEQLVLSGIRALERLKTVDLLRIRYVDLDSPVPPLNPYFLVRDGWCSGVWSDQILEEIHRVRPNIRFKEIVDSFGEVGYNKEGRLIISPDFPKSRVLSLKLANYAMLAGGITIL
ncbi:hypothetical protein F5Y08DRAFT_326069 [Xylaria arbuscula]|uniref:Uncharacterized protein n=1 Tax=Xylaria arbuscula TaxID=114810 RepID=A0A9W8TMB8_9PEZI|nr:hypothetical protein F5Y08DRAFT_326069 [Xylaria arbuscula]KAJ3575556.1 hypothetical protein NPX13_g3992 [Xylaria arbuscula]